MLTASVCCTSAADIPCVSVRLRVGFVLIRECSHPARCVLGKDWKCLLRGCRWFTNQSLLGQQQNGTFVFLHTCAGSAALALRSEPMTHIDSMDINIHSHAVQFHVIFWVLGKLKGQWIYNGSILTQRRLSVLFSRNRRTSTQSSMEKWNWLICAWICSESPNEIPGKAWRYREEWKGQGPRWWTLLQQVLKRSRVEYKSCLSCSTGSW